MDGERGGGGGKEEEEEEEEERGWTKHSLHAAVLNSKG